MILPALVAADQTLAFQSVAPCFTGRHFGSQSSCTVLPGFFRTEFCSQSRFRLHQGSDSSNDGTADKAKKDLQSAAAFVAMKLQMIALTKALEEEASGGGEKSTKIMKSIEKMMHTPKAKDAPKEEKDGNSEPKKPAEPSASSSKEAKSDAATEKKPPIGLKRSSSGTGELPPKPEKKAKEAPKIKIPAETPPKSNAAKAVAPVSSPIRETVVPAAAKDSTPKVKPPKEKDSSSSSRTGLIPSCISTDFGQALPTIVEDLPALRDPVVAKAAPALKTPEKKAAPIKEERAPVKEPVIAPPESNISASDALERMASTPFPSVVVRTADNKVSSIDEKSDSKDEGKGAEKPKTIVTPPPAPVEIKSTSDNKKEEKSPKVLVTPPPIEDENSEVMGKGKEEEKAKAIVTPPPPTADKTAIDSKEEEQEEAPKAIITPPPADDIESNEKNDEMNDEPRTLVTPPPPPAENKADEKEETPKALVTPPPKEDISSDKDDTAATSNATGTKSSTALDSVAVKSKPSTTAASANTPAIGKADKYASMPLGERAFAILKDLGMIKITPDPDDPDYDHSNDDELCSENVWKESKL